MPREDLQAIKEDQRYSSYYEYALKTGTSCGEFLPPLFDHLLEPMHLFVCVASHLDSLLFPRSPSSSPQIAGALRFDPHGP